MTRRKRTVAKAAGSTEAEATETGGGHEARSALVGTLVGGLLAIVGGVVTNV